MKRWGTEMPWSQCCQDRTPNQLREAAWLWTGSQEPGLRGRMHLAAERGGRSGPRAETGGPGGNGQTGACGQTDSSGGAPSASEPGRAEGSGAVSWEFSGSSLLQSQGPRRQLVGGHDVRARRHQPLYGIQVKEFHPLPGVLCLISFGALFPQYDFNMPMCPHSLNSS